MTVIGKFNYDNLFAGDFPVVTDTAVANEDVTRGMVVGVVTEGGKVAPVNSGAADGSEVPYAVIAKDAIAGDETTVYLTGDYNSNALKFGGDDDAGTHKAALRKLSIFVHDSVEAGGDE